MAKAKPTRLILMALTASLITLAFLSEEVLARYYSERLCSKQGYTCIKVKKGDTWNKLFPETQKQELVKRINRTNLELRRGMILAVPNNLDELDDIMDISPFANRIEPSDKAVLLVDLEEQAFAAYDVSGDLVYWGPVSGGKNWCPDVGRGCRTPAGNYRVQSKGGPYCASSKYPIPRGGAPMPYCMFFHGGYALHASTLPGYHDSHGCVRLFKYDAEWLNKEFVETGKTRVIVRR